MSNHRLKINEIISIRKGWQNYIDDYRILISNLLHYEDDNKSICLESSDNEWKESWRECEIPTCVRMKRKVSRDRKDEIKFRKLIISLKGNHFLYLEKILHAWSIKSSISFYRKSLSLFLLSSLLKLPTYLTWLSTSYLVDSDSNRERGRKQCESFWNVSLLFLHVYQKNFRI